MSSINEPGIMTPVTGYRPNSINEPLAVPSVLTKLTPASVTVNPTPGASFILNAQGVDFKQGAVIVFDGQDLATDYINPTILRATQTPSSATPKTVSVQIRRPDTTLSNIMNFQFKP